MGANRLGAHLRPATGMVRADRGRPWVTDFNPAPRTGHIIGVLGGYEQGGDTASVSYSPYFGTAIKNLYHEAIAG